MFFLSVFGKAFKPDYFAVTPSFQKALRWYLMTRGRNGGKTRTGVTMMNGAKMTIGAAAKAAPKITKTKGPYFR